MRTKNVQSQLDESDLVAVTPEVVISQEKILKDGDILVSSANSWNLVGKCCQVPPLEYKATAGGFISILRPSNSNLDPKYLYRWFSADFTQHTIRSFGNQTTNISNLNHKRTLNHKIPLPPLWEQKRIAGILDAADRLRAKRREALAQLDTLLQSTFLDLFGDPVTNPKGWEVKRFKDTNTTIQIGPFGSLLHREDYIQGGIPLINPMHIKGGQIKVGNEQTVSEEKASQLTNYRLQTGDVIMGRRGEMGRCAIVTQNENLMLCGTGSLFLRSSSEEFTPLYLTRTLSNSSMIRKIESLCLGVTMPNLNRTIMQNLNIPLPPLPLQQRFAAIVEQVEAQKTRMRAQLTELDTLFAALQQRAFIGEL
jgi:type I restriction enzyme S subunit